MDVRKWLAGQGQAEIELDDLDDLAPVWSDPAENPIPGTKMTPSQVAAAMADKPFVLGNREKAIELLAEYPAKVETAEQLAEAMSYIDNKLRIEYSDFVGPDGMTAEEVREMLRDEAAEARYEREAEAAEYEAAQYFSNVANLGDEIAAWAQGNPDKLSPELFELALGIVAAKPEWSMDKVFDAAYKGIEEAVRHADDKASTLGIMQEAAKDIPLIQDVEFVEEPSIDAVLGSEHPLAIDQATADAFTEWGMGGPSEAPEPKTLSEGGEYEIDPKAAQDYVDRIMGGDVTADANEIVERKKGEGPTGLSTSVEW